MRIALTQQAMRRAEDRATAELGLTLRDLMERAGEAIAEEVASRFEGRIVIATGSGNNGGDGWVAARLLHARGRDVHVLAFADPQRLRADALDAFLAADRAHVSWKAAPGGIELAPALAEADVIVDALFGLGFSGEPREPMATVLAEIADADVPVLAVDIPSGVEADTGNASGAFVPATVTVTFSALKPGLVLQPGRAAAGEVVVVDVGIPPHVLEQESDVELPEAEDVSPLLPRPMPDDHKGTRGRVLLVVGSHAYTGAAVLAAMGALRMGAGYVVVAAPQPVVDIVHAALPSVIAVSLPSAEDGSLALGAAPEIERLAVTADAIAIGPGLTATSAVAHVVRHVLSHTGLPVVVDADALNVLAEDPEPLRARLAPTLVTPHPGELARILGVPVPTLSGDRLCYAGELVGDSLACVLKGPGTIVSAVSRRAIVATGNAGLAKAGSGDVLTGMLATLLAQGLSPLEAGILGAHVHGRAAELGAEMLTETCLLPTDVAEYLAAAVAELG